MKSERYSSKENDADEIGNLASKLALDLRKHIRSLGNTEEKNFFVQN
jgi:hypothetical protein